MLSSKGYRVANNGFNERWVEELKSKCDILTVIGKYTRLIRKGRSYWGLCPFHHEKTPSFSVNEAGQYYHCFGCGVGGDVIKFVMAIENIDFIDAVKLLADQVGMKLPDLGDGEGMREAKQKKDKLRAMMKLAAKHYFDNLKLSGGARALEYLRGRGIEDKYIVRFGLGASLGAFEMIDYLSKQGYSKELMVEAGLAELKNGRYLDAYQGRLMFPIFNNFGEVVAFGGRALDKTSFAKYKNTTQTSLFDKSKTIYGLNLINKLKQREKVTSLIMVEGYMDTISLVQAGIENVVASMGTALTQFQAKKLKNYCDTVYICYDGDTAGQTATLRGLDILKNAGLKVLVVSLPDGLDPDDVIKKRGRDAFIRLLGEAKPLVEYKLSLAEKFLDGTLDGRTAYAQKALDVLSEIEGSVEKEAYLPIVRQKSGLSLDSLKRDLYDVKRIKSGDTPPVIDTKKPKLPASDQAYYTSARYILSAMLSSRDYVWTGEALSEYFVLSAHKDIYNYCLLCHDAGKDIVAGNLYGVVDDDELNAVLATPLSQGEDVSEARFFAQCVAKLRKMYLDKRITAITARIKETTDEQEKKELLGELNLLVIQSKKI